ncbi:MAG TPA: hypothetical protein VMT29_12400 [Steroidobacteraceae bacterium]|nr:hypothetical protein [Steroidobacteraceae bacterium]
MLASDIVVGEQGMLRIQRLRVTPSLWSMFSEIKRINEVRAEGVVITREALRAAPGWRKPSGDSRAKAEVRKVSVRNAQLQLGAVVLRELAADAALEGGALRQIVVRTQDDRLRVTASPNGPGQYRLAVVARGWKLPAGPPIVFERLDATATLTERAIATRDMQGVLYGGAFKGELNVGWKPSWSVSGALTLDQVDLRRVSLLFSQQSELSGLLSARPRFSAQAHDPPGLLAALVLQSDFVVENGMFQRVDLAAVARNPLAANPGNGGATRFSELSGQLEIDQDGYHFDKLKVSSGLLSASGAISVARDQALSGYLEAAVAGTGELVAVPLRVSGSLKNPSVMPTRSAVAATIAGSVLLPGIGTAVGLKASQLTERLFGASRHRSDAPAPAAQ